MDPGVQFTDLPEGWQRSIQKLRRSCKRYRLTVRSLESRIADLEAGRNVK
jgi:hypothetical protein